MPQRATGRRGAKATELAKLSLMSKFFIYWLRSNERSPETECFARRYAASAKYGCYYSVSYLTANGVMAGFRTGERGHGCSENHETVPPGGKVMP